VVHNLKQQQTGSGANKKVQNGTCLNKRKKIVWGTFCEQLEER